MDYLQPLVKLRTRDDIVSFVTECDQRQLYDFAIGILRTFLIKAPKNINDDILSIIHNALGHFGCKNKENHAVHDEMVRHFVECLHINASEVAQYNLFKRIPFIEDKQVIKNVIESIISLRHRLNGADTLLYSLVQKSSKDYMYEEAYKCINAMECKELANFLRSTIQIPREYMSIQDVQEEHDEFTQALEKLLEPTTLTGMKQFFRKNPDIILPKTGYYLIYTGLSTLKIHLLLRDIYKKLFPFLFYEGKFLKMNKKKIRLGIVSTHINNTAFQNHSVQKVFGRVIDNLDTNIFDITIIAFSTSECGARPLKNPKHTLLVLESKQQETFQETMKRWHTKVIKEELDILFYPDIGMDPYTYYLSFARLAPVQVTTWGHPDCHATTLDYYVTSTMANNDPAQHTEKLILMEGQTFIFSEPSKEMIHKPCLNRIFYGIPEDAVVYMCTQSIFKITPVFDEVIQGILKRDPRAVVVFINTASGRSDYFRKMIEKRLRLNLGMNSLRVLFIDEKIPNTDFIGVCRMADIIIDSFPFTGGITSLECFIAGVPIVTLSLPHIRGSQTTSYYRIMGITDLIAETPEDYITKAIHIANDREYWNKMSCAIKEKSSVFCEEGDVAQKWTDILSKLATTPLSSSK